MGSAYLTYFASLIPMILLCGFLYAVIALAVWLVAGPRAVRAFLVASVPVIGVLILGVGVFQFVAHGARTVLRPDGYMGERQGRDRLAYLLLVRSAFWGLYVGAFVWIIVSGYVFGNRLAGRGTLVSVASAVALISLMGITMPLVDFFNACLVGIPFVLVGTTC